MESLQGLQFLDSVLGADLAAFQPIQDLGSRRRWVRFYKFQAARDAVEPGFDGRVADSENLLHLLDRAMATNEGGDKNLVFLTQPGELRQLESSFHDDVLIRDADALDQDRLALG